jgi:simple sugar transport system substrate-binding protein
LVTAAVWSPLTAWGQAASSAPAASQPTTTQAASQPVRPPGQKTITVGFVQIGAESLWRTAETLALRSEAEARGIVLRITPTPPEQESQIKALRGFIAQKVNALILAPVVETGWEAVLREAREAHIPVFLVDRGISVSEGGLWRTLVCSEFPEQGRMAAHWLAEKTGGKCNIAELQGPAGSTPAYERHKGFEEVIVGEYSAMILVKSQPGDGSRAKGKELMESFLKAEGNKIQAVFAHSDEMAFGAIEAIENAGLKPGKDVLVVSIDATKPALEAIIAGKLSASIECNTQLGPLVLDALEAAVAGAKVPYKILIKDELFDASNAKERIGARSY